MGENLNVLNTVQCAQCTALHPLNSQTAGGDYNITLYYSRENRVWVHMGDRGCFKSPKMRQNLTISLISDSILGAVYHLKIVSQ